MAIFSSIVTTVMTLLGFPSEERERIFLKLYLPFGPQCASKSQETFCWEEESDLFEITIDETLRINQK